MTALTIAVSGVVGLVIGSFLTVVVHRVPLGQSIVSPGSACPTCGRAIRGVDNVPVLAYLYRRGRCRACGEPISIRYLLIELVTGALFVGVAVRAFSVWEIPAYCVLAAALVALSVVDLQLMRLPSPIIYGAALIGAPLLVLASARLHRWSSLEHAAIAAAVCFLVFYALYVGVPRGIGFGDVRLAGLCGGYLGWLGYRITAAGFLLAFIAGGLTGIALVVSGRAGRGTKLPFGPFLAVGTVGAVLFGATIARFWLGG